MNFFLCIYLGFVICVSLDHFVLVLLAFVALGFVRSFVLCGQVSSLLWTPALRPFELVQCASPGRGGDLIGVCGVCVCVSAM